MFSAFFKTLAQLRDPRFISVLIKSIFAAIGVFIITWSALWYGLGALSWSALPFYIGDALAWLGGIFDFIALPGVIIVSVVLSYFLFPAVMTGCMGIFLDDICAAVEEKHYPDLPEPRQAAKIELIANAVKFLVVVIVVNLVALPFYLLSFWVLGLGLVLYYLINGYLMGREYFEQVACRRMQPAQAAFMRRKNRGVVMLLGFLCAFLMTIPFLNLLMPLIATSMMNHLFMQMADREGGFDQGAAAIKVAGNQK